MTNNQLRIAVLALVAGTLAPATAVLAGGWFSDLDDAKAVSLGEILRDPRAFVDVEVKVNAYFHTTGRSYNPYFTRFTDVMYGNFSAWPHNARLYEKRDFQRSYPFFFMQRNSKSWKSLSGLPRVTAIEMVVAVRDVFRGQPWIEVLEWRKAASGLTEEQVRNVVAGDAHYLAGRYDVAADHYGRAASADQPETVRADLFHRLGDAQFQTGRYEAASASYQEALRADPENEQIQRNVAISAETAKRARDRKLAKDAVVTDTPSQHTETVGADRRNDVDDIIAAFEDPAVVEADVEKERLVLEKRGAEVREAARVAAVAGTTPAETVPETAPEAAPATPAEGCGAAVTAPGEPATTTTETPATETPVVEEEASPATPDDPTSAEGCACTAQTPEEADAVETDEVVVTEETASEEAAAEESVTEESATEEVATDEETATEETATEETADGCATETGCEETVAEGCACGACVAEVEDGCGCEVDATEGEETVASGCEVGVVSDPRVVQVSGLRVWVPRLPFFGCEEVTLEQHRAVIEEVLRTPEE